MSNILAWSLFALGVAHIAYGLIVFRVPLAAAVSAGFIGQFKTPEVRRTAFWFVVFGPLLMLAGHVAVHAVATGDVSLFRLIGIYVLTTSIIGVAAFPRSPFLAAAVLSSLFMGAAYGLL
jgi:uncharacterized membrane protein HdeD (DUF308 family)